MMQDGQILNHLKATGAAMTGGKSREAVLDCIVEAVHSLGFDRVRIELASSDGAVLSLKSLAHPQSSARRPNCCDNKRAMVG